MNYDNRFRELIDDIKADKSIVQPWRNKAASRLDEAQAILEKGQRMSYMQQPPGALVNLPNSTNMSPNDAFCICPEGGIRQDCAVHGGKLR